MSIRVLVVDDSMVLRMMLRKLLNEVDGLEVVGSASNGRDALDQIKTHQPDAVTLDIEMPVMSGLEAMAEIHQLWPKLKVVMVSSMTSFGARSTMDALSLGAADFICKPDGPTGTDNVQGAFIKQLARKIFAVSAVTPPSEISIPGLSSTTTAAPTTAVKPIKPAVKPILGLSRPPRRLSAFCIAVSTGGPAALEKLLPDLSENFSVPIFITQHMPPFFTKQLAERLDKRCALKVVEAESGMVPQAGYVYFAPGGSHLTVAEEGGQTRIVIDSESPAENGCRPAADVMMRSLVDRYAGQLVGLVLTGMGQDGVEGCRKLRQNGGWVVAQDEDSSVVWGMPGAVVKANVTNEVLPLSDIASRMSDILSTAIARV